MSWCFWTIGHLLNIMTPPFSGPPIIPSPEFHSPLSGPVSPMTGVLLGSSNIRRGDRGEDWVCQIGGQFSSNTETNNRGFNRNLHCLWRPDNRMEQAALSTHPSNTMTSWSLMNSPETAISCALVSGECNREGQVKKCKKLFLAGMYVFLVVMYQWIPQGPTSIPAFVGKRTRNEIDIVGQDAQCHVLGRNSERRHKGCKSSNQMQGFYNLHCVSGDSV